jgi:hypothetical protein
MIRPFTFVCMLLAGGSGVYLYQVKHRTRMLELQIDSTVHDTGKIREQVGLLRAEWAFLNDPARLQDLAGQQLALKPVDSRQFVPMAELDRHLPPVPPPPAPAPPAPDVADSTAQPAPPAAPQPPVPAAATVALRVAPEPAPPVIDVAPATLPVPPRRPSAPPEATGALPPPHRPAPLLHHAPAPSALAMAPVPYDPYAGGAAVPMLRRPAPATVPRWTAATASAGGASPVGGSALGNFRAALPPPVPIAAPGPIITPVSEALHERGNGR